MNAKKQAGIAGLRILFVLVVFASVLTLFFKLGPIYLDNWQIQSALKGMARQHHNELNELSKAVVQDELSKFYMINNVRGSGEKALKIDRMKDYTLFTIAYEERVNIFANVDAVVSFNLVLDSRRPDECCKPSETK
jgi:hypothetical protein